MKIIVMIEEGEKFKHCVELSEREGMNQYIGVVRELNNALSADLRDRGYYGSNIDRLEGVEEVPGLIVKESIRREKECVTARNPMRNEEIDLSRVEQGLLIKELCQRQGVSSYIGKKGDDYQAVVLKQDGEYVQHLGKEGVGPVNIIVVTNNI